MNPESWELAKSALAEALGAPADQQRRIIEERCDLNPQARDEALRLLRHAGGEGENGPEPADEPPPGPRAFDRFAVRSLLGTGATGHVYLAHDPLHDRPVAIKVLRFAADSVRMRRRLEHEGELLRRFDHPCIARVYEVGAARTELGEVPFVAMEPVDGLPIDAYAAENGLSDEARIDLMIRVCDAAAYAHRRGVIHRDLKPTNIMVDGEGRPRLLDFGIARPVNDALDFSSLETCAGELLGTPGYMSPEQYNGDARAADTRSDVYALGVILYELLARRRLVDTDAMPLLAAIEALQTADPPLLGSAHPHLRGPVEAVVTRAMHRDPRHRYETAAGLADDLRRIRRGQTVLAEPVTGARRLRWTARRHRRALTATALLAAVLTVALVLAVADARHAHRRNEQFESALAAVTSTDLAFAVSALERTLARRPIAGLDPMRERALLDAIGGNFQKLGDPGLAARAYGEAYALASADADLAPGHKLRAAQVYAEALAMADQGPRALAMLDELLGGWAFEPEAGAPDTSRTEDQRLLRLAMTRGEALARAGRPDRATEYLRRVEAAQLERLGDDASDLRDTRAMLDWIASRRGELAGRPPGG